MQFIPTPSPANFELAIENLFESDTTYHKIFLFCFQGRDDRVPFRGLPQVDQLLGQQQRSHAHLQ